MRTRGRPDALQETMNTREAKRVLEAALVCSREPLPASELAALFAGEVTLEEVRDLLEEIARDCSERGVELKSLASGFRFQSRPELAPYLARLHPERPQRFSRAVMETLAIIAFRQPVTRGDIEDIRGVQVATTIVKQLEDRGWIEAIGYRESPGRPALLATTKAFLDDLGLQSLDQLPALDGVDGISASLVAADSAASAPSQAALALDTAVEPVAADAGADGDVGPGTDTGPETVAETDPAPTVQSGGPSDTDRAALEEPDRPPTAVADAEPGLEADAEPDSEPDADAPTPESRTEPEQGQLP